MLKFILLKKKKIEKLYYPLNHMYFYIPLSPHYSCKIHTTCNKLQWYYLTPIAWSCFYIGPKQTTNIVNSSLLHHSTDILIHIHSHPPRTPHSQKRGKLHLEIFLLNSLVCATGQELLLPLRCSGTTLQDIVEKLLFHS